MTSFHFDLITPKGFVFSGEVDQVDLPGAEGDFGVLAAHAPFVTTLRPGIVTIHGGGDVRMVVNGGFVEVGATGLNVLADLAMPVEDFDRAQLAQEIKNIEEDAADTKDERVRDKLVHRLAMLNALAKALQYEVPQSYA
jgi:F-type H+-transporting ATPase subunit epsilon